MWEGLRGNQIDLEGLNGIDVYVCSLDIHVCEVLLICVFHVFGRDGGAFRGIVYLLKTEGIGSTFENACS